jgi:hypothetical protein
MVAAQLFLAHPLLLPHKMFDGQAQMFSRSESMPFQKETTTLRFTSPRAAFAPHEKLVNDVRAGLTPSQLVERKLIALLRSNILPASHLQVSRARRALS